MIYSRFVTSEPLLKKWAAKDFILSSYKSLKKHNQPELHSFPRTDEIELHYLSKPCQKDWSKSNQHSDIQSVMLQPKHEFKKMARVRRKRMRHLRSIIGLFLGLKIQKWRIKGIQLSKISASTKNYHYLITCTRDKNNKCFFI